MSTISLLNRSFSDWEWQLLNPQERRLQDLCPGRGDCAAHPVIKSSRLTFELVVSPSIIFTVYYVMMKYHHRLKAINRNERTRKYVFNMHDKPWINEFIDIELTTNAVFYFFPLRSCSYNSLSLLISWRRVLFWSSSNAFLFSRFWTYCLFLLRFSCAFNRFFSFLKMKTLWSQKHKVNSWP